MKKTIDLMKDMYERRDSSKIEEVYQSLFNNEDRPILIGTSNAELYFTKESIIKLFKSDLEGWGDVYMDNDSISTQSYGPYQVIHIPSTVRQTFKVTDETYKDFTEHIEVIRNNQDGTDYQKLMQIQHLLSHLLSDRPQRARSYDWKLDLDLIAYNDEAFLLMFSMPMNDLTPDVRLDDMDDQNKKIYDHELKLIAPYANAEQSDELINLIKTYITTLKQASNVFIDSKQIILDTNQNYISFMGIGYYTKTVTLDERLDIIMNNFYDDETPKRRLFNIRRDISQHLLHDAIGEQMEIPFRVIGIASLMDSQYQIEYIKVSLPFNLILEEKTNDFLITESYI